MTNYQASETSQNFLDRAATSADQVLNGLSTQARSLQQDADHLGLQGIQALREGAQQLRERAQRATDGTLHYVNAEPVKALLIAAATGAALMALLGLMSRSRD